MGKTAIAGNDSIPANSTVNVLSGTRFENLYKDGMIDILATGSALGLEATFFAGNENIIEKAALGAQNRMPIDPDDLIVDDGEGMAGDKLQFNISNTTGAALTAFWKFVFDDDVEFVDDSPF